MRTEKERYIAAVAVILFLVCLIVAVRGGEGEIIFDKEKAQADQEVPLPEKIRQAQDEFREWQDSRCHWKFKMIPIGRAKDWSNANPSWEPYDSIWQSGFTDGPMIIFKKRVCP